MSDKKTPNRLPLLLILIVLLSAVLHLQNLDAIGVANKYYTAAVESMLDNWHNFFFVAAEPGGSITVDKPPLGLWIQTAFAAIFGVSGFVVTFPNILAGLGSIVLLYFMVGRWFGEKAGLIAAFVLAITPVALAANRNKTADSMLTFTLLLAAWLFMQAVESGRLRHLLWGGLLIGLAFNMKMLQAMLPVPAMFALYFFGAQKPWKRKLLDLGVTTLLLVAVSFSWAVVVDLTPPDARPFIGSSQNNSVMDLIFGYNGIERLAPLESGDSGQNRIPTVGWPGPVRFFTFPLAKELSWMLPFVLVSLTLMLVTLPHKLPARDPAARGVVLWGGWLFTNLIFFSIAGFFHPYYLVVLAPAVAALVGAGWVHLWQLTQEEPLIGGIAVSGIILFTLIFQRTLIQQMNALPSLFWIALGFFFVGLAVLGFSLLKPTLREGALGAAFTLLLLSISIIPAVWSYQTAALHTGSINFPAAYAGRFEHPVYKNIWEVSPELIEYLEANTQDVDYLLAVPTVNIGADYIIQTGRPVYYLGGYLGHERILELSELIAMIEADRLRFVLTDAKFSPPELIQWLNISCSQITPIYEDLHPAYKRENTDLYHCLP